MSCPSNCPYYRESCGESVDANEKFSYHTTPVYIFKQTKRVYIKNLKPGNIVRIETATKTKTKIWYGKVVKVSPKTINIVLYDGPNAGTFVEKESLDNNETHNVCKRLMIRTIKNVFEVELISSIRHIKKD
jgi:hypothetical protein